MSPVSGQYCAAICLPSAPARQTHAPLVPGGSPAAGYGAVGNPTAAYPPGPCAAIAAAIPTPSGVRHAPGTDRPCPHTPHDWCSGDPVRLEVLAVMLGRITDMDPTHQFVALVHMGGKRVTKGRFTMILCPACLGILLPPLRGRPVLRHLALLDLRVVFTRIALGRHRHQRRIDDLPATGKMTVVLQLLLDLLEQGLSHACHRQPLLEHPHRVGVRNPAAVPQAHETLET